MKLKKILTAVASLAVVMAIGVTSINVTSIPTFAASSMKVESYEGKVTLKNAKGKAKTLKVGVGLLSGDNLATQSKSNANILLDKTKAALVEESSAVTVKKTGNDLDLIVDKGSVFFDVSKKLTSKGSFEIKTSNMVCGIRGTVGEVRTVIDKKKKTTKTYVYLLEGSVKVTYNANKTSKKTKTIKAGQKLTVSTNTSTGKSSTSVAKLQSTDIKQAVAEKIEANDTLKTRVESGVTSLDWAKTIEDALAGKNEAVEEETETSTAGIGPKVSGSVEKGTIKVVYDCIYFGNYWQEDTNGDGKADKNDAKTPIKWRILNKNGNDAFVIADQILEAYPYVNGAWRKTDWEGSDLRTLLNGDFLNNAFTSSEQASIKTTAVKNGGNPVYKTGATATTQDKIFLLSLEDMTNKKYGFTNYGTDYKNGGSVFFNEKNKISYYDLAKIRKATPFSLGTDCAYGTDYMFDVKGSCNWILRTNGRDDGYYTGVSFAGYVYDNGNSLNSADGVCPVMHIDLSTAKYKKAGTVTCGPTAKNGVEYKE